MSIPLHVSLSVVDQTLLRMIGSLFCILCLYLGNMEISLFHFDKCLDTTRDYTTMDR